MAGDRIHKSTLVMWQSDSAVSVCSCKRPFSLVVRKHHCRGCGRIFCAACTARTRVIAHVHPTAPQRVCAACASDAANGNADPNGSHHLRGESPAGGGASRSPPIGTERRLSPSPSASPSASPAADAEEGAGVGLPQLIYFDGPGRGELTRLAFRAGGVRFDDTRIEQRDWPAIKADPLSLPGQCFGQIPVLRHGDLLIAQSIATALYAAELGIYRQGVLGDGEERTTRRSIDQMVIGAHADLQAAMYQCLFGDADNQARYRSLLGAKVEPLLRGLERLLQRTATARSAPFFFSEVPHVPSLADLAVYNIIYSPFPGLLAFDLDLSPYPGLLAAADAIAALACAQPETASTLAKSPEGR